MSDSTEKTAILVDQEKPESVIHEVEVEVPSASFNLINSIIGGGIIMLPMAMSHVGYAFGSLLLIIFGLLSGISCYLLKLVFDHTQERTYSKMAGKLFGNYFGKFIDLFQIIYSFGSVIGYAVVIADEFYLSVSYFLMDVTIPEEYLWLTSRTFIFLVVSVVFILPPCLFKNLDALKFTSLVAIIFIIYLSIVIIVQAPWSDSCQLASIANYSCKASQCIIESNPLVASTDVSQCIEMCEQGSVTGDSRLDLNSFLFTLSSFFSLPFFGFSNCCQVQFVPILARLREPTSKRVNIVIYSSFIVVFIVYCIDAFAGYWSFCGFTTSNILDSYPVSDIWILFCRIAISVDLCFSIPLFTHPMRDMFFTLINFNPKYIHNALVSVTVLIIAVIVAILFPNLSAVLGITGSLGSSSLMLIFPGLMYYKVCCEDKSKNQLIGKSVSILFITLGVFFAVMGSYTTFIN
ncbi:hypothetical protein WA158_005493 [Blastocystis sp. Blastoise]